MQCNVEINHKQEALYHDNSCNVCEEHWITFYVTFVYNFLYNLRARTYTMQRRTTNNGAGSAVCASSLDLVGSSACLSTHDNVQQWELVEQRQNEFNTRTSMQNQIIQLS